MKAFRTVLFFLTAAFILSMAHAESDSATQSNSPAQSSWSAQKRQAEFNLESGQLGIEGYDPVAYFSGEPKEGKKQLSSDYRGVTYRFANTANKAAFDADPAKYEPAFGGWCAWAMADDGSKVKINPKTYKIVDGRLFLYYNGFWGNTLKDWNQGDEDALVETADDNWRSATK
ncbi:YHS domain-containing (seleno)protein [Cerasicoccus fimbriatus]|uniref:YHS domain-containing (seleno)protein n=1 Tax=Cerasicoccus fimbriatus TaxID=3014554 RepID=UPI0022B36D42|nr:YHS domain-containing (seleno)protein [Cerasicoccus sp. TK19100]